MCDPQQPPGMSHDDWMWLEEGLMDKEDKTMDLENLSVLVLHVNCPFCGIRIWGTWSNIDSGLRKHLDYCSVPEEDEVRRTK
jgi:hypothetical protein